MRFTLAIPLVYVVGANIVRGRVILHWHGIFDRLVTS